jgi:hypothetical protein
MPTRFTPGHMSRIAAADSEPGDEQGTWPREQLLRMDRRFVERVETAFENSSEHRQSAATNGANASRPR